MSLPSRFPQGGAPCRIRTPPGVLKEERTPRDSDTFVRYPGSPGAASGNAARPASSPLAARFRESASLGASRCPVSCFEGTQPVPAQLQGPASGGSNSTVSMRRSTPMRSQEAGHIRAHHQGVDCLCRSRMLGDPRGASPELGRALLEEVSRYLAEEIRKRRAPRTGKLT